MAKSSVKAGLPLLEENYTEAGVDCYFIRAPLFEQSCLNGLRRSEGNPLARSRLRPIEITPASLSRCCDSNRWLDRTRDRVRLRGRWSYPVFAARAFLPSSCASRCASFLSGASEMSWSYASPHSTVRRGPWPCRPAHPWQRETTSAVRAAGALIHGNLRWKNGRVRRRHPCRVRRHPRARVLHSAPQNSLGRAAGRLRPSGALHSLSNCARPLLFHRGQSWPPPLPRRWAFR